jgi:hypothetical protein
MKQGRMRKKKWTQSGIRKLKLSSLGLYSDRKLHLSVVKIMSGTIPWGVTDRPHRKTPCLLLFIT